MNIAKFFLYLTYFLSLVFSFAIGYYIDDLGHSHLMYNQTYCLTSNISRVAIVSVLHQKDVHYLVNDNFYYTLTNDYVKKFIEQDRLNTRIYRPDKYDCDNYALSLMTRVLDHNYYVDIPYNFAFGMCVMQQHAINLFINDNYNTYCVEPQNDTIFKCDFDMCNFVIM